jgi:signal transduction histidine kinase
MPLSSLEPRAEPGPAGKSPFSSLAEVLNDPARLEVLAATALLDSPAEEAFDRLTRLASTILNTPVSLVSLVDGNHQFFKSQVGLPEPWATDRATPLSHSFCQHVVASAAPFIVTDARQHPLLKDNLAIRDIKVIAYLGVPLTTPEGQTLGSFCAIDGQARIWSEREIKIMQDLASLVMTEIELRLLAKHFHSNYLQLRDLEMEREEMVQMLVHDLRNPLSSLLMGLDLLQIAENPEEGRQFLDGAQTGAKSLLRMVNDILDVSKSQAGRLSLEIGDVSAVEVVKVACSLIGEMATQEGVILKTDVATDVPIFKGDKEKIRRILINLISNAVQHTPRNGEIKVSVYRNTEKTWITFEVADTGRGIPKEAFGQIFEKFNQPKIRNEGKVSTGLGLPFCKMAAEAHGGHISVESEPGQGTIFRFEVPETRIAPGRING